MKQWFGRARPVGLPGVAFATAVAGALRLLVVGLAFWIAAPAYAGSAWSDGISTVADLQAGDMFLSQDGSLLFSDFEFTAVGFDESAFDEFLVQSRDQGLRLILGFGDPFGPGSLEVRYRVTPVAGFQIDGAALPFLLLFEATGADPLLEVSWGADNGASLFGSSDNTDDFPWPGVSTGFAPEAGLLVDQVVTLSGGSGVAKVGNAYRLTQVVPEPATGVLLALATAGAMTASRRRR